MGGQGRRAAGPGLGRLPGRGGLTRLSASAALVVAALLVTGCGVAESAGERIEQEAQERVDSAIDSAVEGAADRIEQELAEQGVVAQDEAQALLDGALDELAGAGATCAAYSVQPEDQRREQMGSLLRAFWLAELETSAPSADVIGAFTSDVDGRCATPETSIATAARESYATGSFGPAAG